MSRQEEFLSRSRPLTLERNCSRILDLRALFDSLNLQLAYEPATAVDVELTLIANEPPDPDGRMSEVRLPCPRGESGQTSARSCA